MDVAVVPAAASPEFHYSPVKLREFQACGRPVVAAAVGQMSQTLEHGADALLVEPGDAAALAAAIVATHADPDAAAARARRGRDRVVASGSWTSRLEMLEAALATR
jgi:glycosyltransferase involved in cell wall biosynthesis